MRIQEQLKIQETADNPSVYMLVSPNGITMNNTLHINSTTTPSVVINSTVSGTGGTLRINNFANNNASIGFYNNLDKYWTTGMRGGNFVISSNYITTNKSNSLIANDIAIQVNQDGFINIPNDMNLWGDIYCKRSLESTNNFSIKATTINDEAKIAIFGGSSLNNYWIIGRNSFAVGSNNLVFGNNTRAIVMQLNQNGDITIPKRLDVGENAYITTLQVNQDAYFVNNVFIKSVNINDIYASKPFIHAFVDNSNGSVLATRGIYSITAAKDGTITGQWNISWTQPHPSGSNYIVELALPENTGFCYGRDKTSTSMTVFTTDDQSTSNFNRKFTILIYNA